jgi:hypothetical protein
MIIFLLVVICLILLLGREKAKGLLIASAFLTLLAVVGVWIYYAPARARHRRELQTICKQNPDSMECIEGR